MIPRMMRPDGPLRAPGCRLSAPAANHLVKKHANLRIFRDINKRCRDFAPSFLQVKVLFGGRPDFAMIAGSIPPPLPPRQARSSTRSWAMTTRENMASG